MRNGAFRTHTAGTGTDAALPRSVNASRQDDDDNNACPVPPVDLSIKVEGLKGFPVVNWALVVVVFAALANFYDFGA